MSVRSKEEIDEHSSALSVLVLVLFGIAASQGIELFVNRILRPDAEEITYYDFLELPDGRMCVVLGDVAGKGVGAAVFLANVRATLRAIARDAKDPRTLLADLSSALLADSTSGLYVTCIVAIVDSRERSMVYVNAGHPAGVMWNPKGARGLRVGGPPAGLLRDPSFEEEQLTFGAGDLVILVSDGITEALDASGDGVVEAIAAQVAQAERPTPEAVCRRLLDAARTGTGPRGVDGWTDDRTAVVFGVLPAAVKSGCSRQDNSDNPLTASP